MEQAKQSCSFHSPNKHSLALRVCECQNPEKFLLISGLRLESPVKIGLKSGIWRSPWPALARLDPGQMPVDREPRAEPAERCGEHEETPAILQAKVLELDLRGIEARQVGERAVQQLHAGPDDSPRR